MCIAANCSWSFVYCVSILCLFLFPFVYCTMYFFFLENLLRKFKFYKIWQEKRLLYMKTNINVWSYVAYFFLEWEMFQTKVVEKIKTQFLCSVSLFRKSCRLWNNVEEYSTVGEAIDNNIIRRMLFSCQITNLRTRTHTYTPPHTHTHTRYLLSTVEMVCERVSVLRYMTQEK
jgi:hypothetical protein